MLKKSYTGFVIWLIGFCAMMTLLAFLPTEDVGLIVRLLNNIMRIGIVILMFMIYKTEKVFWINGVSYEDAVEAGSERRRTYAMRYLKRFGIFAAGIFLYSFIAQMLHIPYGIDIAIGFVGIVACAFSTMRFKL